MENIQLIKYNAQCVPKCSLGGISRVNCAYIKAFDPFYLLLINIHNTMEFTGNHSYHLEHNRGVVIRKVQYWEQPLPNFPNNIIINAFQK